MRLCFFLLALFLSTPLLAAPRVDFAETTHITKPTRIWTEPTKFGEAIASLDQGVEVKVISFSTTGSWLKVLTPQNREGWVPLRHTALAGRRDIPLFKNKDDGTGRDPASLPVESKTTATATPPPESTLYLLAGLGYMNQLNRSAASGINAGLGMNYRMSQSIALGIDLDYNLFFDSASDASANAKTSRKSHKFVPSVTGTIISGDFQFKLGAGLDIDRTVLDTRDLTSNVQIVTGSGGGLVSGADTSMGLAIKVAPAYAVNFDSGQQLLVSLNYLLSIDLSNGSGPFETAVVGDKLTHMLGLGVSLSFGL